MANSRKFVAKTKDVSLTVRRAESFSISYVDCKKDMFQIEENQDGIKFFQREKAAVRNVQANDVFIKCVNGKAVAHNVESTTSCTVDTLNGMSVLEGTITRDASIEVICKNGITEVSDKNKVNLGCRTDGCAHYVVRCLNGKAAVK